MVPATHLNSLHPMGRHMEDAAIQTTSEQCVGAMMAEGGTVHKIEPNTFTIKQVDNVNINYFSFNSKHSGILTKLKASSSQNNTTSL